MNIFLISKPVIPFLLYFLSSAVWHQQTHWQAVLWCGRQFLATNCMPGKCFFFCQLKAIWVHVEIFLVLIDQNLKNSLYLCSGLLCIEIETVQKSGRLNVAANLMWHSVFGILYLLFSSEILKVNEATSGAVGHTSAGELLSKRCVALLKLTMRQDVWPNVDLKLGFFDKLLSTATSSQPNINNIVVALELLEFLIAGIMVREWTSQRSLHCLFSPFPVLIHAWHLSHVI